MRLPRMTTRRWMIAMAVVATGVWSWEIARRAHGYQLLAAAMQEREPVARAAVCLDAGAAQFKGTCEFTIPEEFDPETAQSCRRIPNDIVVCSLTTAA